MSLPFKGLSSEITTTMRGQGPLPGGRKEPCGDLELNSAECLEAYGLAKGNVLCYKFLEDLQECKNNKLRLARYLVMRKERAKKLITGQKSWSERYGSPYSYDSFIMGSFIP